MKDRVVGGALVALGIVTLLGGNFIVAGYGVLIDFGALACLGAGFYFLGR